MADADQTNKHTQAESESESTTAVDTPSLEASLSAKHAERQRLQEEVEAFLNGGGKITRVDDFMMADPPKAPSSNYGGQPI